MGCITHSGVIGFLEVLLQRTPEPTLSLTCEDAWVIADKSVNLTLSYTPKTDISLTQTDYSNYFIVSNESCSISKYFLSEGSSRDMTSVQPFLLMDSQGTIRVDTETLWSLNKTEYTFYLVAETEAGNSDAKKIVLLRQDSPIEVTEEMNSTFVFNET